MKIVNLFNKLREQTPEVFPQLGITPNYSIESLEQAEKYLKSKPVIGPKGLQFPEVAEQDPQLIESMTAIGLYLGDVVCRHYDAEWYYSTTPNQTKLVIQTSKGPYSFFPMLVVGQLLMGIDVHLTHIFTIINEANK